MKKNLITKQLTAAQINLLKQNNIAFDSIPVLDFRIAFDHEKAKKLLAIPDAVWIFTSGRAVSALEKYLTSAVRPKCIFTVGNNAANKLLKMSHAVDFVAKVSEDLPDKIASFRDQTILYFRGRHYRNTLPDFCLANDYDFHSLECYHSIKRKLSAKLEDYSSIWVFSPLSAKVVQECQGTLPEKPVFSIGPVTSDYLKKLGFKNIYHPKVPSFENMVHLFLNSEICSNKSTDTGA